MSTGSIRIWYENLVSDGEAREPLSDLTAESHIHGGLRIEIAGRRVPPDYREDDICFGDWLNELWLAAVAFEKSNIARHIFDGGEQGQPAFVFERDGDIAYLTIADAQFSGGKSDPDWQRVPFSAAGFLREHNRFRTSFFETIRAATLEAAEEWIKTYIRE